MMGRLRLFGLVLGAVVAWGIAVPAAQAQSDVVTAIGNTKLTTQSGQTVHLRDYRGKAVLVYFWGSWCAS
jgi:cytochrome oxidase Cu insertion factor (SCO1/SenC/PrrC family)